MWERFRRFSALERPARSLFLRAIVLLPLVALSLRWRGFRATQATLQRFLSNDNQQTDAALVRGVAAMTARMVNAADRRGLVHPSCLAKSLTLWWLLGRQGISSHMRIGIRKKKGKFEAHAWVERDGTALNEPDEHHHHYAAFDAAFSSLPPEQ
ncbi:MAG TPA: lasso peptide biosynthesis B2 protein [Candidatus Polarisedimenticolia bacterium]|nr:lasso peptide biosynthesis B2 protein [Candidatus Polarisedimenticolia bacterium]